MMDINVRLVEEGEFNNLYELVTDKIYSEDLFCKENLLMTTDINPSFFDKVRIRNGLYSYIDEYIICEQEGKVKTLVSFSLKQDKSAVLFLNYIYDEDCNNIRKIVDYVSVNKDRFMKVVKKISCNLPQNTKYYEHWKNVLTEAGFLLEALRPQEDRATYIYNLDRRW